MSGYLTTGQTRLLGLNAARLRAERGWSPEDLARVSGVHVSTIRKLRKDGHSAQSKTLDRIAAALEVEDPDELLAPWDPDPDGIARTLRAAPAEPASPAAASAAQEQFKRQVAELMRTAARVQQEDPRTGERVYIQLTGRIRQMTQAVNAEGKEYRWLRARAEASIRRTNATRPGSG